MNRHSLSPFLPLLIATSVLQSAAAQPAPPPPPAPTSVAAPAEAVAPRRAALRVPRTNVVQYLNAALPQRPAGLAGTAWQLAELRSPSPVTLPAAVVPGPDGEGRPQASAARLLARVTEASAEGERNGAAPARAFRPFRLAPAPDGSPTATVAPFRFTEVSTASLGLWEGDRPVFVYNHGTLRGTNVPADRARSCYVHPLYGLDGEVLTDDFPKDHYHHRGLFWAWPHVTVAGRHVDIWMLTGIEARFGRWLAREAGPAGAVLGVENDWVLKGAADRPVLTERVWFFAQPTADGGRVIDVELYLLPRGQAVELAGAEGKSYGGLTLRFAPRTDTVITTPLGRGADDLHITKLPWADLSARFAGRTEASGAAVFIHPDHPDFPPEWLTRHYGVLCIGWPGVKAQALAPDRVVRCAYRVWVHRGAADPATLERQAAGLAAGVQAAWVERRAP